MKPDPARLVGESHLARGKHATGTCRRPRRGFPGQVVESENYVLGGKYYGLSVSGGKNVVGRHDERTALRLGLDRERNVDRHLVAVEIRVVRRAHERMELYGLVLDEHRLERLYAQAVERRGPVEKHGMFLYHLVERVPHDRNLVLEQLLGYLYRRRLSPELEFLVYERPEELKSHLLWYSALVEPEVGTHGDDGAAGVVDPLAQKILPEPSLLSLDYVAEALERPVVVAENRSSPSSVFQKRVDGLLEHPLFVSDYYVRGSQFEQFLEPVVPVDDPSVEVV